MRCANQLIVEIESLGENKNNLRRLIEQLSTPIGVIPFIGAGMSIPFGFQGWTEFLLSLASSPTLKSQLKRYIRAGRYEEAAGELCEALGNRGFHDAIENEYGDHKLQDKSLVGAASHLPELVTGPIITTNFDHVLERVFSRASRPFEHVVSGAKADMVAKALHQNRRFLLKIHGDVDDRTDRILTQTDYQKHYCSIPAEQVDFSLPLPRLLQQMTMSRPLFFIGCSLSHDRTVTVLKKVAADFPAIAHYAIVEFPSSRAQYLKQQRHLSKHSIRPVWYTRGRHDLITSLLKYLIEQANGSDSRWRTSVATDLPRSRTSFIGRQKMIVETKQLLSRTTLLTLTGSPGCGKTRLAFQIAEESKSQYHDGVFTIELAALSKSSLLPETIASNLGLREDVTHSVTDTLIGYLREKSLLLVIDNCEHLLADCAILITEILQKCSRVRILTTSREPLHVLGEIELDVPPLTFPPLSSPIIETNALMDYEAIQLFVERASFTSQTFTLTEQNGQFVAQICQRLDGIPLAIELAAAHVKTLTTQQISEELDNRFVILQADDPTVLRRNKQMKAAIDWSYGLLSKPEKTLFRRLSIFMGGFTLDAIREVCSGDGIAATSILKLLSQLIGKSMLVVEEQRSAMRYRFLETLRVYSWDKIKAGEAKTLIKKHRGYFIKLAENVTSQLTQENQVISLERLDQEHDNFRSALERCMSERTAVQAGLRLAGTLWRFWWIRGHLSEGRKWLSGTLSRPGAEKPTKARTAALTGAGHLAYDQGDYAMARKFYEECLAIARILEDDQTIAESLNNVGSLDESEGDYVSARSRYEESLVFFRKRSDTRGIGRLLNNIGSITEAEGDLVSARALHEESLALFRGLGDKSGVAESHDNLAKIAEAEANYNLAQMHYQESLTIFRSLNDQQGIAESLNSLGNIAYSQGKYSLARKHYEESLRIQRVLARKRGIAESLSNLGNIAEVESNYVQARAFREESCALFRDLGDKASTAELLNSLGNVSYLAQDYEPAHTFYSESLALFRELGESMEVAQSLNTIGDVLHAQGQNADARSFYEEGLSLLREMGESCAIADCHNSLGDLFFDQGEYALAQTHYEEALALEQKLFRREEIAETLNNLGNVAYAQGELSLAQIRYEEGLALFRDLCDEAGRANLINNLGNVVFDQGDLTAARTLFKEGLSIGQGLSTSKFFATSLNGLGSVDRSEGDYASARAFHEKALTIFQQMDDKVGIAESLEVFAYLENQLGHPQRAVRLAGAAESIREEIGVPMSPPERSRYHANFVGTPTQLGEDVFNAELLAGRAMTIAEAVAFAMSVFPY